jgi:hypothetical protein
MGREINNGKNFSPTVTNAGLVISTRAEAEAAASEPPSAEAIDALFEQGTVPSSRAAGADLQATESRVLP